MNINIREYFAARSIMHRLAERLPIESEEDEEYIKDRFFYIVHEFLQQYFDCDEMPDMTTVFDKMFFFINYIEGDLDLSKPRDFIIAMAFSLLATAEIFDCSLKVTNYFFQEQFFRVIDQRFHRQSECEMDYAICLAKSLINAGVNPDIAIKMIEDSVDNAETYPHYHFDPEKYLSIIVDGIVDACEQLDFSVTHAMLNSDELRSLCICKQLSHFSFREGSLCLNIRN